MEWRVRDEFKPELVLTCGKDFMSPFKTVEHVKGRDFQRKELTEKSPEISLSTWWD